MGDSLDRFCDGSPSFMFSLDGLTGLVLRLFTAIGDLSSCGSDGEADTERDLRFLSRDVPWSDGPDRASSNASHACVSSGVSI